VEEAVAGEEMKGLATPRAFGFSSKGGMMSKGGQASGGVSAVVQALNPQLQSHQTPRAFGFSRQTRMRKMPTGMGGFGGRGI
jgi:hypothetical protein